ncbi:hypothetical protein KHA80_14425 [Anaerobacillus sp. HL2]|nr:hypothetical protein KHA80_14425 [Anaerobacillus sp. HL2]
MAKMFEVAFELAGKVKSSFGTMFGTANDRMRDLNSTIRDSKKQLKDLDRAYEKGEVGAREYAKAQAELTKKSRKGRTCNKNNYHQRYLQQKRKTFKALHRLWMTNS